jgi:hypothetical protein
LEHMTADQSIYCAHSYFICMCSPLQRELEKYKINK